MRKQLVQRKCLTRNCGSCAHSLAGHTPKCEWRTCTCERAVVGLSKREFEILKLFAAGKTAKEICQELGRSPKTIEAHRANMLKKVGCNNSLTLILSAVKSGLIPLDTLPGLDYVVAVDPGMGHQ